MAFKRTPKGYRRSEYPLPHEFEYDFTLQPLTVNKQHTMVTFFRASESYTGLENVEVNPSHDSFVEETGPGVANGSIIPRLTIDFKAIGSQALWADNEFGRINIHFLPIYISFLESLIAVDIKTDSEVEDILELAHGVGSKQTQPLFDGNDLGSAGTQPLNTVHKTEVFSDYGLSGNAQLENVNFDIPLLYDAFSYYSNAGMLRKSVGKLRTMTLTRDHAAHFFSKNFTSPIVKRANSYMYCGALIWATQPGARGSYGIATDYLNTADHLQFQIGVRFDEWNQDFDQTAH